MINLTKDKYPVRKNVANRNRYTSTTKHTGNRKQGSNRGTYIEIYLYR